MTVENERMARVETLLDSLTKQVIDWRDESRIHRADIVAKIAAIEAKMTVEPELHVKHHVALEKFIERENAAKERREKVKAHVIGWSVVTVISGIGYAVIEFFRLAIKVKVGM